MTNETFEDDKGPGASTLNFNVTWASFNMLFPFVDIS
jgi:hypothetical protein